jgi:uncharacterized protein YbjT (DUF2867 family)
MTVIGMFLLYAKAEQKSTFGCRYLLQDREAYMNIVLGAAGQIGFLLASTLARKGQRVRAVIRNEAKAHELKKMGIEVFVADYLDKEALTDAFQGAQTAFLLTPENPKSKHQMEEVSRMIDNYREAVQAAGIQKIVGLSSMGAQHPASTGNLLASYRLEHAFGGLDLQQTFVRPAYYYSNWVGYRIDHGRGHLAHLFSTRAGTAHDFST